ncbi:MAG TPA: DHA2 family efflux MFS transporter permease subunit, partial [Candidatus Dormibacteraeota bacterium]
ILLDTTIVNVAIPSIIDGLKASLDQVLWILNSYLLVYAVLLITAGRFGDLYGPRNLFALGLLIFTVSSAVCGFAQDPNQLIVARIVQGFGGALLTPQTLAVINTIFPPERRGAAFGIWGAVAGVAAVAGPTLGGWLTTDFSWRWIFYVNVPIGILALIATFAIIPDLRPARSHRLDVLGVLLSSIGLFLIVFGLIEGQRYDWGVIWGPINIYEVIAAGVVVFAIFIAWERFVSEPLIPLDLFRIRNYSLMNWTSIALAFGMFGLFFPITIYLQSVLGMSALRAGLTMAPMAGTSMLTAPWAGRLADRIGGKYILMVGLTAFGIGMALLTHAAGPTSQWYDFTPYLVIAGFGMGCTFAPMTTVAMRNIEPRQAGAASGVFNTTRQVGAALGSSVVGAVLQARLATSLHDNAVAQASQLPAAFRGRFIDAFSAAGRNGLQVGRGQTGAAVNPPPGLPEQVKATVLSIGHDVFVNGFLDAMRQSLVVPIVAMFIAAASCVLIERRKRVSAEPVQQREPLAAAGGGS